MLVNRLANLTPLAPARTPKIRAKAIRSQASAQLPQHSRRRQIPMAPAALSVPHTPRFRALALFGRRLSQRGDGLGMPASENLHIRGHEPSLRSLAEAARTNEQASAMA
jgi:hypothetical protein